MEPSIIAPKLDRTNVFPVENDQVRAENFEPARDESANGGNSRSATCPLAGSGNGVYPPSGFACRHVFVAGDLDGFEQVIPQRDPHNFIEMTRVAANPFADQLRETA